MNEKLEFYWSILNKTLDHIKFSDAKAALLLTFYGILLSLFFGQSAEAVDKILYASPLKTALSAMNGILSLIAIYFAFSAINPRLKNPTPTSIIYFGDIHKKFKTADEYFEFGNKRFNNPDEVFKDLSNQVYVNSSIAHKKFFNVTWAIRFFVASIVTFLILSFL